ncbi:FHA domain-containing protein [Alienimonas sp. DA493]|uniref:FHA domain-containing protein n=1 Tax=Alienimonas sp. DA493 TaxID=3373605 RepID=UPI00375448CA
MRLVFTPLPPANGGPPVNRAVPLDRPVLFFGRHPDCDVSPQGSAKVSRRHCCVAEASGRVRVRDLGSLNGTWVNDRPVRREAPLVPGDVLRIGDVGYRLERLETVQDGSQSGVVSIAPTVADAVPPGGEPGADSSSDVVPI